jgi:hypothetical protein
MHLLSAYFNENGTIEVQLYFRSILFTSITRKMPPVLCNNKSPFVIPRKSFKIFIELVTLSSATQFWDIQQAN